MLGKKIEVQLKGKKWSLVQAAFTDFGSVVQLAQFCSAQSEHCLMLKNHSGQCSLFCIILGLPIPWIMHATVIPWQLQHCTALLLLVLALASGQLTCRCHCCIKFFLLPLLPGFPCEQRLNPSQGERALVCVAACMEEDPVSWSVRDECRFTPPVAVGAVGPLCPCE